LLQESAKWREDLDKQEKITLNQAKFNQLMKTRKEQIKKFKVLSKYDNKLIFTLHANEAARSRRQHRKKRDRLGPSDPLIRAFPVSAG